MTTQVTMSEQSSEDVNQMVVACLGTPTGARKETRNSNAGYTPPIWSGTDGFLPT